MFYDSIAAWHFGNKRRAKSLHTNAGMPQEKSFRITIKFKTGK